jgi:hypothetical protein
MARRSHQALAGAAAGTCLVLVGCGGSSAPAAAPASSSAATAAGPAAGSFCADATSFMQHIPAAPKTRDLTSAEAKANMTVVLAATVHGFAGLEKAAPGTVHAALRKIVRIYKKDEKIVRASASLATASQAMAKENTAGTSSFQRLLRYISEHCH